MANETDKRLFEEIGRVFDSSAMVIKSLAEEIVEIEPKFGSASSLVKKKREQLQALRNLYDKSLGYINYLRELNHNMYTEFMTQELLRHQKETGLPFSKIMQLAGQDPKQWEVVDAWDERLKKIKNALNIPDELDNEFEEYINSLRGGSPTPQ